MQQGKIKKPKFIKQGQWKGYTNPIWQKQEKNVSIIYGFIERRKTFFMRGFIKRMGYSYIDIGDHVKEDVRWGKEFGNRMQCNPLYFTSGALIRKLFELEEHKGMSKEEIVKHYVFLGGGGQCGPCRYGMYPQEYLKVVNDAGFKGFRIFIFNSDISAPKLPKDNAIQFTLNFRINLGVSIILADLFHIAECALRPRVKNKQELLDTLLQAEEQTLKAFSSKLWFLKVPRTIKKLGKMFAAIEVDATPLPQIVVTGENFANYAHNEGNYDLRRFIMDEGCEVLPGIYTHRILYDNWRRKQEAKRGIKYAIDKKERSFWKKSLRSQNVSDWVINYFYNSYTKAMNFEAFGGKYKLPDLDDLAAIGKPYYHPEIFGGEGNLEIGEAIHYADSVDGFISSKPFGCMPSSGVSDGVQAKIMSLYPQLNFLSIETSGDNEVSIMSRVSMLLFKAKQNMYKKDMFDI